MAPTAQSLEPFTTRLRLHSTLLDADADALARLPWTLLTRPQNAHIVREGDATMQCLVLLDGFAHRFRTTANGERQILTIYVPGDPIDFDHLFLPEADDGLQAIRDCVLASTSQAALRELMAKRPAVGDAIVRALMVDASIFREWTLNVGQRDARTRIAHLLCEIALRLDAQGFDFANTPIPLTQDQLADATGLSQVHVNRTLRGLRLDGVIERRGALVIAPNLEGLRQVAGFDRRYLHARGASRPPPSRG